MVTLQTQVLNKICLLNDFRNERRSKTKTLSRNCNGLMKDDEL